MVEVLRAEVAEGTIIFVVAALDNAGNIHYLNDTGNPFSVEVTPVVFEYPLTLLFGSISLLAILVVMYRKIRKT